MSIWSRTVVRANFDHLGVRSIDVPDEDYAAIQPWSPIPFDTRLAREVFGPEVTIGTHDWRGWTVLDTEGETVGYLR